MKKSFLIFLPVFLGAVLIAQENGNVELKERGFDAALTSIEHYTQYIKTFDDRDLIQGVKYASESVTLLNLYLESSNDVNTEEGLDMILYGTKRLCNDLAEDIITSDSIKNDVPGILTYLEILKSKINKIRE